LRGGASTRRHPKRCASTDHKPGPNIARAAPAVPNSSQTDLSPASVRIFQISINATDVPAMGVHRPKISSVPAPIKSTAGIVTFIVGRLLHSRKPARTISTEPTTTRMRSNPVPGQPPANVEYNRRKKHLRDVTSFCCRLGEPKPQIEPGPSLFRVFAFASYKQGGWTLQLDDSSLQSDHCGLRSIIGA